MIYSNLPISPKAYIKNETLKKRIVIGDTYYDGMGYINLLYGQHVLTSNAPHFTILKDGKIFNHFDLKYYSNFVIDSQAISIALDNLCVLDNNLNTLFNTKYNGEYEEKEWKKIKFFTTYSKDQIVALRHLLDNLLSSFNTIQINYKKSNIYDKEILDFTGICYRSNYNKKWYDVNPTFPFEQIIDL